MGNQYGGAPQGITPIHFDLAAGASPAAIQAHYDVGNEFYRLWLDDSMTYSCALWSGDPEEGLESAQRRKLEFHAAAARAENARRVLDIGCGWGSMLRFLTTEYGVQHAVGLSLSEAQVASQRAASNAIEARLESWVDHEPTAPYDAIISLGAIEHFVKPEHTHDERVVIYRSFFAKCHGWLQAGGWLSLQTMGYGNGKFVANSAVAKVFPESDMPRLTQLAEASDGLFRIDRVREDGQQYARTCRHWLERLRDSRERAVDLVGPEKVDTWEHFLAAVIKGYEYGIFVLYRISFQKVG